MCRSLDVSGLSRAEALLSQYIPLIGPSSGPCGHSDRATRPLHGCSLLHFKRPFLALVGTSGPSPSLPHPPKIAGVPAPLQIQLALVPQIPLPSTQGPQRDVAGWSVSSQHTPRFFTELLPVFCQARQIRLELTSQRLQRMPLGICCLALSRPHKIQCLHRCKGGAAQLNLSSLLAGVQAPDLEPAHLRQAWRLCPHGAVPVAVLPPRLHPKALQLFCSETLDSEPPPPPPPPKGLKQNSGCKCASSRWAWSLGSGFHRQGRSRNLG